MRLGVRAAIVDGRHVDGDVEVADGRVVDVGLAGGRKGIAVPGFVDLQVNGFGGVDLLDPEPDGYSAIGQSLARTGVTAYQPTLITSALEDTLAALEALEAAAQQEAGPHVIGAHLEGPFLSRARAGTHTLRLLEDPDPALLDRLLDAGPVTMMTLAPELDGSLDLIQSLVGHGVVVAVGHSDADATTARAAFDAGATAITHLFNAMRPFQHRDPAIPGAALTDDRVAVGLIVDGIHLADETVLIAWRTARQRTVLVTDAIAAAGVGDGTWRLGDITVEVNGLEARRADGVLAGSVLTMDAAVRNAVDLGVGLVDAVAAATSRPAKLIGRPDLGTLTVGSRADLVVLDDDLRVERTLIGGDPYP